MNTQIIQEASDWFVDFREGDVDPARRQAFSAWLRTSPAHIQAYLDVSAFWEDVPQLANPLDIDTTAMIATARAANNVRELERPAVSCTPVRPDRQDFRLSRRTALAASGAFAFICAGLLGLWLYAAYNPMHRTAVGEQKSLTLADGSTVELNSRSRIRIHFTAHERAIELMEGQALFNVARDAARPFIVRSGSTRVRAVGTQFDVYKKTAGITVTVLEGRVAINETAEQLGAGEQVVVTAAAVRKSREPDVAAATAWTQRQIIFHSASVAEMAEEFNRYNHRQVVVDGADFGDSHMSGVFSSTDPASLVRFLRERFDVRVIETADELRISR